MVFAEGATARKAVPANKSELIAIVGTAISELLSGINLNLAV